MHTNKVKAKVDFKFCMGSIPAMLRATKPVLSERQYKELCTEVNKVDGYLEQKRIIFSYVDSSNSSISPKRAPLPPMSTSSFREYRTPKTRVCLK